MFLEKRGSESDTSVWIKVVNVLLIEDVDCMGYLITRLRELLIHHTSVLGFLQRVYMVIIFMASSVVVGRCQRTRAFDKARRFRKRIGLPTLHGGVIEVASSILGVEAPLCIV